jgi:hypothetical protein
MKILAAVGLVLVAGAIIVLQLSGWSQAEPKTVNLSSATRSADGPPAEANAGPAPIVTPPAFPRSQPTGTSRFTADVRQTTQFIWPALGPLSSYFGAYHQLGIDIALSHGEDSPIIASAHGIVEFAGGSSCCDYGLYVVLAHDGNRRTLYGHLSSIQVTEGEEVIQGQMLGLGGSTGVSDGKHLHFEIHEGDKLVDPLRYLPAAQRPTQLPSLRTDCSNDFVRIDPDSQLTMEFTEAVGYRPVSAHFDEDATAAGFAAGIEGQGGLTRRVSIIIPPAPSAKGFIRDASLTVTLTDGPDQRTLECALRLATMQTMANAPRVTRHPGGAVGTPTATPIRSKYPTPTPPPSKTPQVTSTTTVARQAQPAVAGTPKPGATAPKPVVTQPKPVATVKPPQQFPITR